MKKKTRRPPTTDSERRRQWRLCKRIDGLGRCVLFRRRIPHPPTRRRRLVAAVGGDGGPRFAARACRSPPPLPPPPARRRTGGRLGLFKADPRPSRNHSRRGSFTRQLLAQISCSVSADIRTLVHVGFFPIGSRSGFFFRMLLTRFGLLAAVLVVAVESAAVVNFGTRLYDGSIHSAEQDVNYAATDCQPDDTTGNIIILYIIQICRTVYRNS